MLVGKCKVAPITVYAVQSSLTVSFHIPRHLWIVEHSDKLRFTQLRLLVSLPWDDKNAYIPARYYGQSH